MVILVALCIITGLLVTPIISSLAWKVGAVSRPDGQRRTHARPTPELGGLAVLFSLMLATVGSWLAGRNLDMEQGELIGLGLSAIMFCLLGCFDDKLEMRAWAKLLGQLLAATPVIVVGLYFSNLVLFGHIYPLGWAGPVATLFWIIAVVNAMNLIDGMDGLASTIAIIVSLTIAMIGNALGQPFLMLTGLGLAGGLAGFLAFNLPPAKIYLGDCGSLLIGFLLAVMGIQLSEHANSFQLSTVVILLFLPLMDMGLAIVRRTFNGCGIMAGDRQHIHHRLQDQGYTVWQALGLLTLYCCHLAALALLIEIYRYEAIAMVTLAVTTTLCVKYRFFGHEELALITKAMRSTRTRRPAVATATKMAIAPPHTSKSQGSKTELTIGLHAEGSASGDQQEPVAIQKPTPGNEKQSAA